jgi:uncharacterized protein (DUF39 family)
MGNDILAGGRGEPILVVRDQGVWQQQVADEQIKARVAQIRHDDGVRQWTKPATHQELADSLAAYNAVRAERNRQAREEERQLEELTAWAVEVELELASAEKEPTPTRWGRPLSKAQLAFEEAQAREAIASWRS